MTAYNPIHNIWQLYILFICFQFLLMANGDYIIQLELRRFINPSDKDYNNKACDFSFTPGCEHQFYICVDRSDRNEK